MCNDKIILLIIVNLSNCNIVKYSTSLILHVATLLSLPHFSIPHSVSYFLLLSYSPTSPPPACLSPCVCGGGGGGCAGREYELPGRQAVFCLEDCCQHGEDGWGETGERWDWQLQPTFIHPSIHPPTPLSPSRPHPLSAPFLKSLSFFLSEGRYKEICHRFSKNRILRLTCLMGQRGKFELKHTSWSKTTAQIKVFNAGLLCFFAYECHQLLFSQRLVSF